MIIIYAGYTAVVGFFSFLTLGSTTAVIIKLYSRGHIMGASIVLAIFGLLAIGTLYTAHLFNMGKIHGFFLDIAGFIDGIFFFVMMNVGYK